MIDWYGVRDYVFRVDRLVPERPMLIVPRGGRHEPHWPHGSAALLEFGQETGSSSALALQKHVRAQYDWRYRRRANPRGSVDPCSGLPAAAHGR
jgi:hypothetical protein